MQCAIDFLSKDELYDLLRSIFYKENGKYSENTLKMISKFNTFSEAIKSGKEKQISGLKKANEERHRSAMKKKNNNFIDSNDYNGKY